MFPRFTELFEGKNTEMRVVGQNSSITSVIDEVSFHCEKKLQVLIRCLPSGKIECVLKLYCGLVRVFTICLRTSTHVSITAWLIVT